MGSIIYTYQQSYRPKSPGGIVQSFDIFDFSVIHLSVYERLIKRYGRRIPKTHAVRNVTKKMTEVSNILQDTVYSRHNSILTMNDSYNAVLLEVSISLHFLTFSANEPNCCYDAVPRLYEWCRTFCIRKSISLFGRLLLECVRIYLPHYCCCQQQGRL